MKCPKCGGKTRVSRSEEVSDTLRIRYRYCVGCGYVYRTAETELRCNQSKDAKGEELRAGASPAPTEQRRLR